MVITFVLPGWSIEKPIGGFKVVYEYANRLSERGHRINVVHPLLLFPDEATTKQKVKATVLWGLDHAMKKDKVKWFHVSPKVNILIVGTLREENLPNGDVIIATAWQTAEWINRYGPDKGKQFYLIQHYENWSGPDDRVKATWKMPLKKIVISRWLVEKAKELDQEVAAYIPNGLDLNQFRITNPIEYRNPRKIGMLYHIYDWKGSKDGIEALKIVRGEFSDLQVVFFSVYKPDPEVPSWVEFHNNPSPKGLVEIYNDCAIFVSPSWSEGWALPPAEAMACGCALVATDSKGVRDYAIPERTALVSEPKNSKDLARNLIKLLNDQSLRIRLAMEGNRYIQRFTWYKAVKEFEEVITQK